MDFQDWKDERRAELAAALIASRTPRNGFNIANDSDDDDPIETVKNPNHNGSKWFKVTAGE